jgi:RNA polymerase sigma factor for flagellar operon FliA
MPATTKKKSPKETASTAKPAAQASRARQAYDQTEKGKQPDWEKIEQYLPLVKAIVSRMRIYFSSHIDMDDIYSVGVAGLISAVQKFDPTKGKSFSAYASLRIKGSILDELRRIDWMPRAARSNSKMLRRTIEELEAKLNRPAKEDEIRAELGMTEYEYAKLLEQVRPISFVPIDESPGNDDSDGPTIQEAISDVTELDAREMCENREVIEIIRERIDQLPDTPKKVLVMYYFQNMRLAEIAEVFGLTEARICQIHTQAVISLRSYLRQVNNR